MTLLESLQKRSGQKCELCGSEDTMDIYGIPPKSKNTVNDTVLICGICSTQLENSDLIDSNHWRCLNESMWSEFAGVQVLAWRMLQRLKNEGWPQDLLEMMYLDDDTLNWAKAMGDGVDASEKIVHKDVNGVELSAGDSVVLIKDLPVKGSSMVAKRGTAVRRISLDPDNADYIEGKVDGIQIVIITRYVKKI
jgi:protein PhnA